MTCNVGPCPRNEVVEVDHHGTGCFIGYCRFHAYDRDGALRWFSEDQRVRLVVRRGR